jgi:hypothetical protein
MSDNLLSEWQALGSPIFRPSAMTAWNTCPAYRQLKDQGVEPVTVGWSPAITLGNAIHAGLAYHYRVLGKLRPADSSPGGVALASLQDAYVETPEWSLPALEKLVAKGLQAAIDVDITRGRQILLVDEKLKVGHPDLILVNPDGTHVIVDNKVTMQLDPRWAVKRLAEYETADQWWQYAWELGGKVQEVGGMVAHITVLTPKVRSFTHAWDCPPAVLEKWFRGAMRAWIEMEKERLGQREPTWKLSGCYTKFGKCPYYDLHFMMRDNLPLAIETGYYKQGEPNDARR